MEANSTGEVIKWISEVLKHENFDKLEFEFPKCDCSGGYIADILFVTTTGKQNGKTKKMDMVVKSGKVSPEKSYKEAFVSEINIYSRIIPYMQEFALNRKVPPFNDVPFCYGTLSADDRYVIILENLKIQGFKLYDVGKPLDLEHTRKTLEVIATWHAHSFALKDQMPEVFKELTKDCRGIVGTKLMSDMIDYYVTEMDLIIDLYKKRNRSTVIQKLQCFKNNLCNVFKDASENDDENYVVIAHGDCWKNNILYHYKDATPDKVALIDWQLSFITSPLLDVTQLLFTCCSRKELDHIDDLLKFYHDTISQKLREFGSDPEKCFPWKICESFVGRYVPLGILAMPTCTRFGFGAEDSQESENSDWNYLLDMKLTDPEAYFKRIDDIYELCIERGYL